MAVILLSCLLVLGPGRAMGEQKSESRLALVIGNSNYKNIPLLNPVNDANAMIQVLEKSGFKVTKLINATRTEMEREIIRFGRALRQSQGVGLFYYAGHAVQVGGRNYLVPIGSRIEEPEEIRVESVDLEYLLARMDAAGNPMNMVILDACRDNPFGFNRLSVSSGLATVDAPVGTLLAYSTAPGKVAADGRGRNGLYTEQLVRAIQTPGLKVEDAFKRVRRNVARITNATQIPWELSSLTRDFYFNPTKDTSNSNPTMSDAQVESALWNVAHSNNTVVSYENYISQYPKGMFTKVAKIRLSKLKAAIAKQSSNVNVDINTPFYNKEMVAVKRVNIRKEPSINSDKVGALNLGESVTVTGQKQVNGKNWYRIRHIDGTQGFVYAPLLSNDYGLQRFIPKLGPELLAAVMSIVAVVLLFVGFPSAFILGATAFGFGLSGFALGYFDLRLFERIPLQAYDALLNDALIAIPLFIFMGEILIRSKLAHQLLEALELSFGRVRGGLAISAVIVGLLMAATTGTAGALVATMGMTTLPFMLRAGYSPRLASGTVLASGTLGQLIPPSIVLVLLADVLQASDADVRRLVGDWQNAPVSAADLFAGALVPGLLLVVFIMAWVIIKALIAPDTCPPVKMKRATDIKPWSLFSRLFLPPIVLVVAVLGSILFDVATPTEAAGLGAIGAILLAGRRTKTARKGQHTSPTSASKATNKSFLSNMFSARAKPTAKIIKSSLPTGFELRGDMHAFAAGFSLIALFALARLVGIRTPDGMEFNIEMMVFASGCALVGIFIWGFIVCCYRAYIGNVLASAMRATARYSSMVFVTFLGATIFLLVFQGFNGDDMIAQLFAGMPGGHLGAIAAVMTLLFFLGFVLDYIGIVFLFVPIFAPVLFQMDTNPIWLGVLIIFTLQLSFLAPPLGFSLTYLRRVAPKSITNMDLHKGVLPFVAIQALALILVVLFPELATWLPAWLAK